MKLPLLAYSIFASIIALEGAPAAVRDTPEKVAGPDDEIICKKFSRTGSLVAKDRVCKSRHDWQVERAQFRSLGASDSCRDAANGGFKCGITLPGQ